MHNISTDSQKSTQSILRKQDKKYSKNKILYLEFLRGFAIFFVIFNHTGTNGFNLFSTYQPASLQFWISLGVAIFCKFSVPVFFAISGALALGKDPEPLGRLWRKKILKFSLILIIISLIYYLELIYRANGNKLILEKGWINDFILKLYSGDVRTHLWYMYAFIAYLIGLPFLQSLVKHLEDKHYYYMVAICLLMNALVPITQFFVNNEAFRLSSDFSIGWICTNVVIYPCLGYYIHKKLEIKHRLLTPIILWIVNIACISIASYVTYLRAMDTKTFDIEVYHYSFLVINMICVYITGKLLLENRKIPRLLSKYIRSLGSCTFGIYLLHMIVKDQEIFTDFLNYMISLGLDKLIAVLVYVYVLMIVSWIITFIISKIPLLKKLVGF